MIQILSYDVKQASPRSLEAREKRRGALAGCKEKTRKIVCRFWANNNLRRPLAALHAQPKNATICAKFFPCTRRGAPYTRKAQASPLPFCRFKLLPADTVAVVSKKNPPAEAGGAGACD
jgi:hypothetical protein